MNKQKFDYSVLHDAEMRSLAAQLATAACASLHASSDTDAHRMAIESFELLYHRLHELREQALDEKAKASKLNFL